MEHLFTITALSVVVCCRRLSSAIDSDKPTVHYQPSSYSWQTWLAGKHMANFTAKDTDISLRSSWRKQWILHFRLPDRKKQDSKWIYISAGSVKIIATRLLGLKGQSVGVVLQSLASMAKAFRSSVLFTSIVRLCYFSSSVTKIASIMIKRINYLVWFNLTWFWSWILIKLLF